jgi:hypothetical protein
MVPRGNSGQLFGAFLLDFGFFTTKKGTLVSGYRESTLGYRSNVHECATILIRSRH